MTQLVAHGRCVCNAAMSYEDTIRALNGLQSNAQYLLKNLNNHSSGSTSLRYMKKYLIRSGLTLQDVDKLSIIHVAGTKGKGSTCAFTEKILRDYGFRTGFYSSPHLVQVTERIRINGQPIKESLFSKYFWQVYNVLNSQKEDDSDMPTYFKFITVVMFHIFLNADIDVVILEVGIGGEYDCTNVISNPVCEGITSLGLDHTGLLGNTLEEIARQKSGIFKPNSIAFTVPQPENAMRVLRQTAIERNCRLYVVPAFKSYDWKGNPPVLGMAVHAQETNASLAIQLAHTWILERSKKTSNGSNDEAINISHNKNPDSVYITNRNILNLNTENHIIDGNPESLNHAFATNPNEVQGIQKFDNYSKNGQSVEYKIPIVSLTRTANALSSCKWPGRTQVLCGRTMDFYLDGAHTTESIEICTMWYLSEQKNKTGNRFLIFNTTGNRDVSELLKPLKRLQFKKVYFVPNIAENSPKLDQLELNTTRHQQQSACSMNCELWGKGNAVVLKNVQQALTDIAQVSDIKFCSQTEEHKPQVLVTGSLHLVGAALALLDPHLAMKTNY
ncbi:folylpolyglutamate synthase, mitochondrial-like isoform X2 [Athalia rosae]|nr:folylpolyglutamate synthase, mitochondrial-like isoform X2 [Athalia rosae]